MNVKLLIAIIQFISQLLRWMNRAKDGKSVAHKIRKFVEFKDALADCEKGEVEKLEKMFTVMRPVVTRELRR